jgi:protein SCO1/2
MDESLYLLDATWNDQNARPMQLASLRGKPVILSMIFTRCGWACPTIVRDMKKIAGRLQEDVQNDFRYVLVSMDPERDTPDVLSGFAREHQLESGRWTLLRGTTDDVRMLAALLGIRYRKEASGQFSHTNLITILNSEGEVAHVHKGLESDPDDAGDALRNLLAEKS